MKVAKHVQRKLFDGKEGRFSGAESHAAAIFTKMVSALQTTFVIEDIGFFPLFTLDDATLAVRVEANNLLFSTLELLIDPSSPRRPQRTGWTRPTPASRQTGQADMFAVRITAGVDPHGPIEDFNAALKAARTHVRAGTATASAHRYSHGTHFMERDVGGSDATSEIADLRTMVLDFKRQLAAFLDTAESVPSPRGFTPRADKPDRRVKTRFAASPLPKGGNWSQSVSKKVAFHRNTGATIPYCQNQVCAKGKARHWHRDCPNGGRTGLSAYAFAEEAENSVLAARFQHAIDHDDSVEFDALCMLAGGKPEVFTDLSACSFCEENGEILVSAVTEFSEMARTAGASTFNVNTFTADLPVVSEPPARSPPASVESEEEWTGPPNPFCPPVTRTFADFIEGTGVALEPDEPAPSMNLLSAVEEPERVMDYEPATYATSDDDDEDDSVALQRPRYGCGNGVPRFARSLLTSSLVCALFVICATAAPHAVAGVGGADARTCTAPPVGGATWAASAVPTTGTSPTAVLRGNLGDTMGDAASTTAIPPHRQTRYRELRQGFHTLRNVPRPPWLVDPDPDYVPPSPPYPPPPYSSDDEEADSGDHAAMIENSTVSSTNDSPPAPEAGNYFTLTLLRAGPPAPRTSSG
ncbi:hypothetical protein CYMTET_32568 [Cymbomonas tetramitiformis]|uniref:Uncharacterized protein n=1 Tax=Cymbomonas tetramitiformis TaxID=36881 RepID=A0AAE0FEH1_9CHLO|nr:hypothetical protein CYMTET_32568 [Cymbomonas tetramitiformis]